MKKYTLFKLSHYGEFYCKEEAQESGEVFLIGKWNNKGKEHIYIKQSKDKQL